MVLEMLNDYHGLERHALLCESIALVAAKKWHYRCNGREQKTVRSAAIIRLYIGITWRTKISYYSNVDSGSYQV